MLLSMYQAGALKLDELVTRRYRLDQINEAMNDHALMPRHPRPDETAAQLNMPDTITIQFGQQGDSPDH